MNAVMLATAPALVAPAAQPRGTVVLLHGQGADALAMMKELSLLQGAGFNAVGLDAPNHGRRYNPERDALWEGDKHAALDAHVTAAATEMPAVLDALEALGHTGPFGIVGISLGGFSAWRALTVEPRLVAAVPLLGSPALLDGIPPDPAPFRGRRILAISAEHDEAVPGDATRELVPQLAPDAEVEWIVDCGHAVPEADWFRVWGRILMFFDESLR